MKCHHEKKQLIFNSFLHVVQWTSGTTRPYAKRPKKIESSSHTIQPTILVYSIKFLSVLKNGAVRKLPSLTFKFLIFISPLYNFNLCSVLI